MPQRHCLACEITLPQPVCDWCGADTLPGVYPDLTIGPGFGYDGSYAQAYPALDPREIA